MYGAVPAWLPALLSLSPWKADTYEMLYFIFRADFLITKPVFDGHNVTVPTNQEDGKESIFWHLTTTGSPDGRLPDLRRAERLPWIKPTLENCRRFPAEVMVFSYREKRSIRVYIWLPTQGYVIILKRLGNGNHMLITAFYMEREHSQEKIRRKYVGRIK